MICLVYGPTASGKSAWAEDRACELACGAPLAYFATMRRGSGEAQARIEKHLAQRAGKDFVTYEIPTLMSLRDAPVGRDTCVLLDDVGNLVANEMFGETPVAAPQEDAAEELAEEACRTLLELAGRVGSLVVVADAVGEAGWRGGEPTLSWIACCGAVCCKLAAAADEVVEVRDGLAMQIRGDGAGLSCNGSDRDVPRHQSRIEVGDAAFD